MANVLLLTLPRPSNGVGSRPFRIAFQAAGWVMVLIFGSLAWFIPDRLFRPLTILDDVGWILG